MTVNPQEIKEALAEYLAAQNFRERDKAENRLMDLECRDKTLPYFMQINPLKSRRATIVLLSYHSNLDELMEVANALCSPDWVITIFETIPSGGMALFHSTPLGMIATFGRIEQ